MSEDGERAPADADNPYAKPAQDLPALPDPDTIDDRLGRVAGWMFLCLGALSLLNMAWVIVNGGLRIDLGAIAMLLIGRGLLKRNNTARRWGIGCAGTYLGLLVLAGGVLFWWRSEAAVEEVPNAGALLGFLGGALAVFALLLWLLLHPRTRAAYGIASHRIRRGGALRTPRRRPPAPPPG